MVSGTSNATHFVAVTYDEPLSTLTIRYGSCLFGTCSVNVVPMFGFPTVIRSLFVVALVCVSTNAAANEFNKNVADFTKLSMSIGGSLELVQSDEHRVELNLVSGDLDDLEVRVRRGTLELTQDCGFRVRCPRPYLKIEGTIYFRTIERLAVLGGGRITAKDLTVPRLNVAINGAGDVDLGAINSEQVQLKINGAGDVSIRQGEFDDFSASINGAGDIVVEEGSTTSCEIKLVGSGGFRGTGLKSTVTDVKVTGAGDAQVHASETLNIAITGSGDVSYEGTPKISSKITGSGVVSSL